jgi:aryl-alcohol dehydrogenase-like predicted oxidoreductase
MPHRNLGGLSVSVAGLGCNNFSPSGRVGGTGTREVIDAALDVGITSTSTSTTDRTA